MSSGLPTLVPSLVGFAAGAIYQANPCGIRRMSFSSIFRRVIRARARPGDRAQIRVSGALAAEQQGGGVQRAGQIRGAGTAGAAQQRPDVGASDANVRQLVEMGFDEAAARAALQQAGNSVDRALATLVG